MTSTKDPLWYKDAVIYQAHVRAFFDSTNDGVGDFPGLTQKLDYLQEPRHQPLWLLPFYPSPLQGRRLRHRGLPEHPSELRDAGRFRALHRRSASPRHPRHHRAGHQPHLRSAPVVPGGAAGAAGSPERTSTSGARRTGSTTACASSSPTPRRRTGAGTTPRRPTTGTASSTTSRT